MTYGILRFRHSGLVEGSLHRNIAVAELGRLGAAIRSLVIAQARLGQRIAAHAPAEIGPRSGAQWRGPPQRIYPGVRPSTLTGRVHAEPVAIAVSHLLHHAELGA